jgi:hypothetical protein
MSRRYFTIDEDNYIRANYHSMSAKDIGTQLNRDTTSIWNRAQFLDIQKPQHLLSQHPLYTTLRHFNLRCYDATNPSFKDYGGRGICVADYWRPDIVGRECAIRDFVEYAISIGWTPGLQIDRINNNGNYDKGNIRFVSQTVNMNNRRNSKRFDFNGKAYTVPELSRLPECNIEYHTLRHRIINRKWDVMKAISQPPSYKGAGSFTVGHKYLPRHTLKA